jgi:hypothetical protein
MVSKMTHDQLLDKIKTSAFNRSCYTVNQPLNHFNGLKLHCDYDDKNNNSKASSVVENATPDFQRSNNKWTEQMQRAFVENALKGNVHNILFFKMHEDDDAKIIDGLQRLTAIAKFIDNELSIFNGLLYSDFDKSDVLRPVIKRASFRVNIYTFSDWESVGRFYVEMNENITHSSDDIKKAKDWFKREHGIDL